MDNPTPAVSAAAAPAAAAPALRDRRGNVYQPAVSPRLKALLFIIFGSVAVLGASGAYLASISLLNWWKAPQTYTNQTTLWMFLIHVAIGVVIVLPFVIFGLTHYTSARTRKNRLAVKLGLALFVTVVTAGALLPSGCVLVSGASSTRASRGDGMSVTVITGCT